VRRSRLHSSPIIRRLANRARTPDNHFLNCWCSPEAIDKSRAFLQAKLSARRLALDECYGRAVNDFNRMTKFVIEKYNPKRIWQWGSLLNRRHFSEISDIDMALEGLRSIDEYMAILAELTTMTDFPLDVVEMERIGEENANHIREFGRMVYERIRD
jgi:predicted nucleotidyltransferase